MQKFKSILLSSTIVYSLGLLLGRVSGFLREIVIANTFKVSAESDKIILLLTVPDFINNLLSVTTVGAIILPLFVQFEDRIESIIYVSLRKILLLTIFFIFLLIIIISYIFKVDTIVLLLISLISVIPNVVTSVFVPYVNHNHKFFVPSLGTLIYNLVIILFLLFSKNLYFLAFGIIIAATVRLASVYFQSLKIGITWNKIKKTDNDSFFSYKVLILSIVSNGILFINPLLDKVFASRMLDGSVSILSYSEKIYLLPVSVYLTSIAVTSFPTFVKLYTTNRIKDFINKLWNVLLLTSILGLITAIIFIFFNDSIINIIFGITELSKSNLNEISKVTIGYVPLLILSGINAIIFNAFYAIQDYKSILRISIFLILMKVLFNSIILFFDLDLIFIPYSTSFLGLFQLFVGSGILFFKINILNKQ